MSETTIEINDVPHPIMYLVASPTGGLFGSTVSVYSARGMANNAAKAIGGVVLAVPVIADYRERK